MTVDMIFARFILLCLRIHQSVVGGVRARVMLSVFWDVDSNVDVCLVWVRLPCWCSQICCFVTCVPLAVLMGLF